MNQFKFGRVARRPRALYDDLIGQARRISTLRGHDMKRTIKQFHYYPTHEDVDKITGTTSCKLCGATYTVTTNPAPNDDYITGNAIATNCTGER